MAQLRLRYGGYKHPDSEAAVRIERSVQRTDAGQIHGILETWVITGRLEADTQAEMTTKIQALEAAYRQQADVISLQFADTGNDTAHVMQIGNMLSPIEVIQPPSYPIGEGPQYAGYRDYQIVIQGLVDAGQINADLLAWDETIEISGGYPRDVLVQTLNTPPIRQRAALFTPCIVRQFGSATSNLGWPIPPPYRFNVFTEAVLLENAVQKRGDQGKFVNGRRVGTIYTSAWSYAFGLPFLVNPPGSRRPLAMPTSLT